jgi:hypothetical protein
VRARAIEQFVGVLGNPHSSTNYVLRWNLGAELDVVLERRGPEHRAVVWVPWYGNGTEPPLGGKVYTSDEGRHGHTYAFAPTLAEGLPALRITIEDDPKLESVGNAAGARCRFDLRRAARRCSERAVDRADDASGYKALVEMGMKDLSFEAVVLRHPQAFKPEVVARCKDRLEKYELP